MKLELARSSQRGAALIAALFAVIVVAALGIIAMRLNTDQQQQTALRFQSERVHAAATSALELGVYRAATNGAPCNIADGLPHSVSFNFGATARTLNGFKATVTCVKTQHQVLAYNGFVYSLQATASRGTYGSADYVQATLSKLVSEIPPGTW